MAKALRADILEDIRGMVDKALAEGTTFRDFQKQLEPLLKSKGWWGRQFIADPEGNVENVQLGSPWRLRTIYEVNLQTAYAAGHYKQQIENVESRPWWMYVGILDSRIRPAHRAMHGLVFRYDDPFWQKFYPPNGWNCRCTVRALTGDQVKERGARVMETGRTGVMGETDVAVGDRLQTVSTFSFIDDDGRRVLLKTDAGWSYNPGVAWQIDLPKYSTELQEQMLRLPGPRNPAEVRQEMSKLRTRLESDRASIRARQEDISNEFMTAEHSRRLELAGEMEDLTGRLRELHNQEREATAKLLQVENPAKFEVKLQGFGKTTLSKVRQAVEEFRKFVSLDLQGKTASLARNPRRRDYYSPTQKTAFVKGDTAVVIHELGHWLEDTVPEHFAAIMDFYRARTAGEQAIPLSRATGNRGYSFFEVTKVDRFMHPYMGKVYPNASEITSMALQYFYERPLEFAEKDPEMFDLIYNLVRGVRNVN